MAPKKISRAASHLEMPFRIRLIDALIRLSAISSGERASLRQILLDFLPKNTIIRWCYRSHLTIGEIKAEIAQDDPELYEYMLEHKFFGEERN